MPPAPIGIESFANDQDMSDADFADQDFGVDDSTFDV